MPDSVPLGPWRVVFVEDDPSLRATTKTRIEAMDPVEGRSFVCQTFERFDDAIAAVPLERPDVLVLDVFEGRPAPGSERPGLEVLAQVKATAFLPVVIYTAASQLLEEERAPFVRVVGKGATGFEDLAREIRLFLEWRIPQLNRALRETLDATLRDYLWDTVQNNWATFRDLVAKPDFGRLIVHRLAEHFVDAAAGGVVAEVYGEVNVAQRPPDTVHPASYYVIPPSGPSPRFGEIRVTDGARGADSFVVVLTPTCDMISRPPSDNHPAEPPNVDRALCAATVTCGSHNSQHRFHLPPFLELPAMDVEFQELRLLTYAELDRLSLVGCIASPFAESLSTRFSAWIGRVGVPALHPAP
ncbi:MAG: hypothetical protein ACHQ2Y_02850 [Candidatus Lutacidiplasmatales archaeon]